MGRNSFSVHIEDVGYLPCSVQPKNKTTGDSGSEYMSHRDVEKHFDISTRSLKFYDYRGIVRPKIFDGIRWYSPDDIKRIEHIQKARHLGYTLREAVSVILDATVDASGDIKLPARPDKIESQIERLEMIALQIDRELLELRRRHYLLKEIGCS